MPTKASRVSRLPKFPERDWANLLDEVTENDRLSAREQMSLWEQGLLDGEANAWGRDYVTAMQAALEQRDAGRLLAMLDAGLPIPRFSSQSWPIFFGLLTTAMAAVGPAS